MRARVRTSPTDRWHRWLGRETSSTLFIPEIDGLRFIAIASVILYHLSGFYLVKTDNYGGFTNGLRSAGS